MAAHPTYRRFLVNDSMMALNAAIRRASTDNLRVREGRFLDADTTREQLQDLYDQVDGAQDPWLAERVADLIPRAKLPRWVRSYEDLPARFSVFHGTVKPARIREYV